MPKIPIIEMVNISKSFPGVIANDAISFQVYPGQIHALLGENGAGKSTLMSILAGLYHPDGGQIKVRGKAMRFYSPRNALDAGVGMIYQHLRLVDNLTVAENIVLGDKKLHFRLNSGKIIKDVEDLSQRFGMKVDPNTRINQLSLGEQQRVEILKMIYRGCDVLIMDEPTTVLTPPEVKELFKIMRLMTASGKAVILITHKLNEVMEIADYVTVLRKGQVAGDGPIGKFNEKTLTSMMVAREINLAEIRHESSSGQVVLEMKNLSIRGNRGNIAVDQASLQLHRGEIVALAGVAGNGQRELVEALAGLRPLEQGTVILDGEDISSAGVRQRLEMGITMIPEDRMGMGLVPNLSIMDNSILRNYYKADFLQGGFLNYKKIRSYTQKLVSDYNIYLADINYPVNYLSGGNLQKLLLGREIDRRPRVLIASYPVRGLDVAAADAVYNIILKEREAGTAILLVLEDLEDIFRIADRVAVMYNGKISRGLDTARTDIDEIGALMLGAEKLGVQDA